MDKREEQEQIRAAYESAANVKYIPPIKSNDESSKEHGPLRVAAYCRVSTDSSEQLKSYETQIAAYKKLVQTHPDWELVNIYADEGISGTSLRRRKEFLQMMDDCRAGKIDMIITKSISRFARNVVDCVTCCRELRSINPPVAVFFEDVGINTLTQTGELLLVVLAAVAQGESEMKSTSVKWGFRKRFEAGLPKISPLYGYDKDGRDLYINDSEAIFVKLMYQMFIDGYPISHICMVLNSDGIRSPRGVKWSYSTVKNILQNEKYCGDVMMQKTVCVDMFTHRSVKNDRREAMYLRTDYHTPIVERDVWVRAQERFSRRRQDQYAWEYWTDPESRAGGRLAGFSVLKVDRRADV